jgi:hypothetical protein
MAHTSQATTPKKKDPGTRLLTHSNPQQQKHTPRNDPRAKKFECGGSRVKTADQRIDGKDERWSESCGSGVTSVVCRDDGDGSRESRAGTGNRARGDEPCGVREQSRLCCLPCILRVRVCVSIPCVMCVCVRDFSNRLSPASTRKFQHQGQLIEVSPNQNIT